MGCFKLADFIFYRKSREKPHSASIISEAAISIPLKEHPFKRIREARITTILSPPNASLSPHIKIDY